MNSTAPLPKCCCCRASFQPDHRNSYHQRFCSRPRCRRASKRASQRRWLKKAENRAYFCGPHNVRRVQEWRKEHPEYSRKPRSASGGALQENWMSKSARKTRVEFDPLQAQLSPLQDVCRQEFPLLVGLIARIEHCPLQEDMAVRMKQMVIEGQCILDRFSENQLCVRRGRYRQIELAFS